MGLFFSISVYCWWFHGQDPFVWCLPLMVISHSRLLFFRLFHLSVSVFLILLFLYFILFVVGSFMAGILLVGVLTLALFFSYSSLHELSPLSLYFSVCCWTFHGQFPFLQCSGYMTQMTLP